MEETGKCRKCPGNLYKNVSIKLKNVKCITELDKSLECYELLGSRQKMVNACKMLATDVGAVKGKDKAEWALYTHISAGSCSCLRGRAECVCNLVINILYLQCALAALKGTSIAQRRDLL